MPFEAALSSSEYYRALQLTGNLARIVPVVIDPKNPNSLLYSPEELSDLFVGMQYVPDLCELIPELATSLAKQLTLPDNEHTELELSLHLFGQVEKLIAIIFFSQFDQSESNPDKILVCCLLFTKYHKELLAKQSVLLELAAQQQETTALLAKVDMLKLAIQAARHDLRNKLATLLSTTYLIEKALSKNNLELANKKAKLLQQELKAIQNIIELLQTNNWHKQALDITQLTKIFENYRQKLQAYSIDLEINHAPNLDETGVLAITELLSSVIDVTMDNAIKSLELKRKLPDAAQFKATIQIKFNRDQNGLLITITDNGLGLSLNNQDIQALTSPGTTYFPNGSGYGLANSKRSIEVFHHGKLSLSATDESFTVAVWLPQNT